MTKAATLKFCDAALIYGEADDAQANASATIQACRALDFTVEAGQSVALIGPSGCGKSTTLLMAAGLLAPTTGAVFVNDQPVAAPRSQTAFIPQDLGLFPWKTVLDNAALGLRLHGASKQEANAEAQKSLDAVGLRGFESAFPKDLSGGMRQRLALARALAMEADLLLMDEPLSAIDALRREALQDLLLAFIDRAGCTSVLVTHSIEEAVYLGQRIFVFSERPGTVVATIDNFAVGALGPEVRDSAAFAAACREVRQVLNTAAAPELGAIPAERGLR